jgi:hypothetical protein
LLERTYVVRATAALAEDDKGQSDRAKSEEDLSLRFMLDLSSKALWCGSPQGSRQLRASMLNKPGAAAAVA